MALCKVWKGKTRRQKLKVSQTVEPLLAWLRQNYNVASLKAKQAKIAESIEWLEIALKKGYDNCDLIKTDPDLRRIRNETGYNRLMQRYCRLK